MYYGQNPPVQTYILILIIVLVIAVGVFVSRRRARFFSERSRDLTEARPERLRNVLWDPLDHELRQVLAAQGAVTEGKSAWSQVDRLAQMDAGVKFRHGMLDYLRQRRRVADTSEGLPQAGPVPPEVQAERDKLVEFSEELRSQVRTDLDNYRSR